MLGRIFTVGGYTLLSRVTGLARDIMLAAILGAGPLADAFLVAWRLPNNFRAIFAEGAFNTAFIPAYAHVQGKGGETSARLFADRIFTLLFFSQLALLVVAWLFMPQALRILAPGFTDDAEQRRLAIELTRITFPYLLLITLVTLYGGMLNVMHRFASAAAASIFLNISMMATLALVAFFPTAGHAAAWGVLISGFLQYFLLAGDLARHGSLPRFAPLRLDEDVRAFFRAIGPATLGSMGTQRAVFARGAYTRADAAAAAVTLAAYAIGLIPFVTIRSAVSAFYARKDTATPVKASLAGLAVNLLLKIVLMGSLAQVGLALATAVGAWINLLLVLGFSVRAGYLDVDRAWLKSFAKFVAIGIGLGAVLWLTRHFAPPYFAQQARFRDETLLVLLMAVGAFVYGLSVLLLFGRGWLFALVRG